MWKNKAIYITRLYTNKNVKNIFNSKRTFLSESYKCTEAWSARQLTPILQKVKVDDLYYELEQGIQQNGKPSAIDVDIFANVIHEDHHFDEVTDLLHKLRLSSETGNTLDSTSHAVIRAFHETGKNDELLNVLNDRLNYGVFLDSFTANLLMDGSINSRDFKTAARVASMVMLQEDWSHSITNNLALYSCYHYLKNPEPFEEIVKEVVETKKKKEEIKVRVKFLRNNFYDDHFDIKDSKLLVGKTLSMFGSKTDTNVGYSCNLLGLVLYKKYDKACKLIETVKDKSVYSEILDLIKKEIEGVTVDDSNKDVINQLNALLAGLKTADGFENHLENSVAAAVKTQEQLDISEQCKIYEDWNKLREQKLGEQLERLLRAKRVTEAEKKRKELEEEERKLWFFEREDQMDLDIDAKRVYYPIKYTGKKKKPRVIDEGYIPPEIKPRRN